MILEVLRWHPLSATSLLEDEENKSQEEERDAGFGGRGGLGLGFVRKREWESESSTSSSLSYLFRSISSFQWISELSDFSNSTEEGKGGLEKNGEEGKEGAKKGEKAKETGDPEDEKVYFFHDFSITLSFLIFFLGLLRDALIKLISKLMENTLFPLLLFEIKKCFNPLSFAHTQALTSVVMELSIYFGNHQVFSLFASGYGLKIFFIDRCVQRNQNRFWFLQHLRKYCKRLCQNFSMRPTEYLS